MYEQFMGDYTQRDSASRQVQLFISFVNFRATSLVSISYIFPPTVVLRTLFLILNICYELTILVGVLQQLHGNGSLNQFSASLFVSLFVHQEPQQIFVGQFIKSHARVNVPITLPYIHWVCQYKLFLIPEGWEGFTEPSKPSLEHHQSDNQ